MIVEDKIIGSYDISSPVLLDILNCDAIERLKNVRQAGVSFFVNKKRNVTRYEHSIAVMLLIKRLGGSLEEQVAGLLHDFSHTAFSHTIDYLENNKEETYHESTKSKISSYFGVNSLLERHNIPSDKIFNENNYSILEQPQPDLCADRIDYALRDLERENIITLPEISEFLQHLTIVDGKIVITDKYIAKWFCESFDKLVNEVFLDPLDLYANFYFAKILNIAIENNVIKKSDLVYQNDLQILNTLENCEVQQVKFMLSTLSSGLKVKEDKANFEMKVFSKCRIVDPLILSGDNLVRCTECFPELKKMHSKTKEISEKGLYIRRIS